MTDRQRNKLKRKQTLKSNRLREYLISSEEPNGLPRLGELGISEADLTHEFLLGRNTSASVPILGLLIRRGYLPQIPESCLPASVVLATRNYPQIWVEEDHRLTCLQYCASIGKYGSLPQEYHSKSYVCGKPTGILGPWSPLTVAVIMGCLHEMPLGCLRPGDLSPEEIKYAQYGRVIEVIESLLLPQDIMHISLRECFSSRYFPTWVRKNLTIEKVRSKKLADIVDAVAEGSIHFLPVSLLKGHYIELHEVSELARGKMLMFAFRSRVIKRRLLKFEGWLLKMADEILRDKGSEIRASKLSFSNSSLVCQSP